MISGWTGEEPEAPVMPVTTTLLAHAERGPGDVLAETMARTAAAEAREAADAAAAAADPDERGANLVARGYRPGMATDLSLRLGDVLAEIEAEQGKIAAGERRRASVARMLGAGQIGAMDASAMTDGDFGDATRVEALTRQADRLRTRLTEATATIAPAPQRQSDQLESATSRAHAAFRDLTRERMAAAAEHRTPAPRPFASRSGGAPGGEPHACRDCASLGVTGDESVRVHAEISRMAGAS